jgi:putative aldouronate transport system permease protein
MLYPFLFLFTQSINPASASAAQFTIIPEGFDLSSYRRVLGSEFIIFGLTNTLARTILGTGLSLAAIVCTAYPLAKTDFPHRKFWMGFIVFTVFFSGGLIPNYLLIRNLNLLDKLSALILPGLIPTFTMIIMRNFFMSLPVSLDEAAKIDGAHDGTILLRIILPLSTPILATVTLWQAVSHWNAWFDCLIYIQTTRKQVLQVVLRRLVLEGSQEILDLNSIINDPASLTPEAIKAAAIMVTTLPIILLYPLVQKYFIQGIMVGSIKG